MPINIDQWHSVHPHPFLLGVGGVEPPTKFSKRWEDLTGPQILEGGCWERGGDFFQRGVAIFTQKMNYNLKYLMANKSL